MTIVERLTAQVRAASEDIRKIKDEASRMEEREYVAWIDGKGIEHGDWAKDRKFAKVRRTVQVASINPKHEKWVEYQRLKKHVSVLLTQKAIIKALGTDAPRKLEAITKDDVRNMIDAGFLRNHAKRPGKIAYGAARLIRRLARFEQGVYA